MNEFTINRKRINILFLLLKCHDEETFTIWKYCKSFILKIVSINKN